MAGNKTPTIDELFRTSADQLKSDFEAVKISVPHHGTSGGEAEDILRKFLNSHLPRRFAATAGFVIDEQNQMSRQSDVLIYDAENSPIYREGESSLILPADSIASVIEVKSKLSKKELSDAVEKVASVKKLIRSPITLMDQPVTFSDLILNSIFGVVFAYGSKTSLEALAKNLRDLNKKMPRSEWTDLIVVLDKGMLGYYVQFPGEKGFLGQIMPPASKDAIKPPYYVHLSISNDAKYALNRFFATLMVQLTFFRKRSSISLASMLRGSISEVKTIQSYWFDSKGDLQTVPSVQFEQGPKPNWSFDVFVKTTQEIIGRYSQHVWADGYVYQVIPCSPQSASLMGLIAGFNQKSKVHVIPSKDQLRGFTTVLSGVPPTRQQVKEHLEKNSKGLEIKWHD